MSKAAACRRYIKQWQLEHRGFTAVCAQMQGPVGCNKKITSTQVVNCPHRAPSVLANGLTTPIPGPSPHTKAEQEALQKFADTKSPGLPHLVATKLITQDEKGPMPGGYISYTVMTLMPGKDLMEAKFWSMPEEQQNRIRDAFRQVIKYAMKIVHQGGI